ncbi:choice-of-anchor G family protein, partial [Nesterenkonia alkaliphila]|nr:choice-of-anchor G family protein [Nesterenkonia alkaliphila]
MCLHEVGPRSRRPSFGCQLEQGKPLSLSPSLERSAPPPGRLKRWMAYTSSAVLAAGLAVAGSAPAQAAPDDVSEALGKFLGGSAVNIDLDDIAEVNGALAENPSGEHPLVTNPLGAEVLNVVGLDLGDGLQLFGPNGVIQLGAVNQYAEAADDGRAEAASGAVADQGGIAVGASDEFPSDATLDLSALLSEVGGAGTSYLVEDLSLQLGAVSSSIEQVDGADPVPAYQIAGATLNIVSPAVGGVYDSLEGTVDELQVALEGLSSELESLLGAELGVAGVGLSTDVTFTPPDLSALLPENLIGESSGVTVNLATGAVTVDLETLLAANPDLPNLNAMPANSELLSGPVVAAIADGITQAVTDVVTEIVTNLETSISETQLGVSVGLSVPLLASVDLSVDATIGELLAGNADDLVTINTSGVVGELLNLLGLGSVTELANDLVGLLTGALGDSLDVLGDLEGVVDDITGPLATEVVGPLLEVVNQVVAVTVNAQPGVGDLGEGSSTVRAVEINLLPNSPLATVQLASSTVRGTDVVYETSISANPDVVEQGAETVVTGEGFAPGENVTVSIPGEDGVETTANDDGTISVTLPVPDDYGIGPVDVTAVGDVSETPASTTITVIEPDAGDEDGDEDGTEDGVEDGTDDGDVDGTEDGTEDGVEDGTDDGDVDGTEDGVEDGTDDGDVDGTEDGVEDGTDDGDVDGTEDGVEDG